MIAAVVGAALLLGAGAAHAEKRVFIVANNGDGYGVDRCLASNAPCAVPASGPGACRGGHCDDFVAIECTR
jgi:hypothetical protein